MVRVCGSVLKIEECMFCSRLVQDTAEGMLHPALDLLIENRRPSEAGDGLVGGWRGWKGFTHVGKTFGIRFWGLAIG